MTQSMQNKIAVVTGATSGIGRASVVDFARHDVNVVASGRREDRGAELVDETQGLPGDVIFVRADVTVAEDVENLMSFAVSQFGRIDYAFNNAGGGRPPVMRLHEYSDEHWDHYSDTFLKSVWRCMKHEIEHMLPNQSGVIINNASIAGLVGGGPAYTAMKHGVVGLTKGATKQYAGEGLRFNAVCPGWIDTEMTAAWKDDPDTKSSMYSRQSVKRPGEPEEVAALVRWMCSDEAAFVSGVAWPIDGGFIA